MGRGAWQVTVHGVTKELDKWLKNKKKNHNRFKSSFNNYDAHLVEDWFCSDYGGNRLRSFDGLWKNRSENISTFIVYMCVCVCVCSEYVCVCVVCIDIFPATYEFCNLRNTKVVWSQEL